MDYLSPYIEQIMQSTQIVSHLRAAAEQKAQLEKQNMHEQQRLALSEKIANANELHQRHAEDMQDKTFERSGKQQDFNDNLTLLQNTDAPGPTAPPAGIADAMARQQFPGSTGQVLSNSPIPQQDPARMITAPGGQRGYVPTHAEQLGRRIQDQVDTNAILHPQFTIPDEWAETTGAPKGMKVPQPTLSDLGNFTKRTAGEEDKFATHGEIDNNGTYHSIVIDKKTGQAREASTVKGVGKTKAAAEMTPGQIALQDRFERRQAEAGEKKLASIETTMGKLQTMEQSQHALKSAYGEALNTKEGEDVIDPRTRRTVPMTSALRKLFEGEYRKAEANASSYADQQKRIRKNYKLGEFGEGQAAEQPTSQTAKPESSAVSTGIIIRNKATGERKKWDGKQWQTL